MRGKIILIEGTDCSGKQTQSENLVKRLQEDNIPVKIVSFPNYNSPTGRIIGGPYLGKQQIGESWFKEGAANVNPKVSSLYFAADRYYNLKTINDLLDQGINVILDRYVFSNMAHQGGKITNKEERYKFYQWIDDLEFKLIGLPYPDMIILLYMPYQYSIELRNKRKEIGDGHESSTDHLINAETSYLELANLYHYHIINCVKDNQIRTITNINEELYKYVKNQFTKNKTK
ncbi:MAG: thymidylate kinase [Bacilli bacterium]|jgi:dTMP kinase|nr:thymidylate kinase [Bacilli bacterium]